MEVSRKNRAMKGFIGGWAGSRIDLDAMENILTSVLIKNRNSILQVLKK
jgi:hypothetical protein